MHFDFNQTQLETLSVDTFQLVGSCAYADEAKVAMLCGKQNMTTADVSAGAA